MNIAKSVIVIALLAAPAIALSNPFNIDGSQSISSEQKAIQDLRSQLSEIKELIASGSDSEDASSQTKETLKVNGERYVRELGQSRFSRATVVSDGGEK